MSRAAVTEVVEYLQLKIGRLNLYEAILLCFWSMVICCRRILQILTGDLNDLPELEMDDTGSAEDDFELVDSVVFADPWWIGTKDENPDELRLPFPQGLAPDPGQAQKVNFGGGAGQLDEATPPRTEKAAARKKKANSISPASDIGEDDLDPEVPDSTGESESPIESKSE
ncbi:hypothetical protein R1sor_010200 [Riccia sorocarpa]|uniref:Uncharacterized protein n=1 Tax=Riccia sorocarpa TaxID=122646 RepID=A0ABD3I3E3_9MARC